MMPPANPEPDAGLTDQRERHIMQQMRYAAQMLLAAHDPAARAAAVQTPPSAAADDDLQAAIAPLLATHPPAMSWVRVEGGQSLFQQGDPGDSLYIVVDGLLRVIAPQGSTDADGVLVEVGRGDTLGEMALLSNAPRSATVIAARDSELIRLTRAGFEAWTQRYPHIMGHIAVQMAERLRRVSFADGAYNRPVTLALVPVTPEAAAFGRLLADALRPYSRLLYMSRQTVLDRFPAADDLDALMDDYDFQTWFSGQERRHDLLILEGDFAPTRWTRRCIESADRIYLLAAAWDAPRLSETEKRFLVTETPRMTTRRELVLFHRDRTPGKGDITLEGAGEPTDRWLDIREEGGIAVTIHHHVALHGDAGDSFDRFIRFVRGVAVGVVCGGGGIRGAAHVGVFRALNEIGLPIDFVGGTSAGALAAAALASGRDDAAMQSMGRDHLYKREVLLDGTLPLIAVNAGRRITEALKTCYGNMQIEDLWLPFFAVSTNVTLGQQVIHRRGPLYRAVRASTSIPGVYPPIPNEDGDLLVDGAILNNLPANVMRNFVGTGLIVAIDVAGELGRRRKSFTYGEWLSGWQVLLSRINPFMKSVRAPSVVATMLRTMVLSSASNFARQAAYADIFLQPPVDQFALFDVSDTDAIYQAGYTYAREKINAYIDAHPLFVHAGSDQAAEHSFRTFTLD